MNTYLNSGVTNRKKFLLIKSLLSLRGIYMGVYKKMIRKADVKPYVDFANKIKAEDQSHVSGLRRSR
ncbi:MAG: hypothetical protein C3F06_06880 [Candidatus Methanoperedenaceae archaeon]|nr:MAG: hypothetical protein C3F06_06880 [Candidatus Methanoperedenaceae archaeon]